MAEAKKIVGDAKAVAEAGAFCVVVEGVMERIADDVTKAIAVPTIGIGASANCDGQVLVTEDMLGLFERTPRFVKRYDDLATRIAEAAATYREEVRARGLPDRRADLPPEGLGGGHGRRRGPLARGPAGVGDRDPRQPRRQRRTASVGSSAART